MYSGLKAVVVALDPFIDKVYHGKYSFSNIQLYLNYQVP